MRKCRWWKAYDDAKKGKYAKCSSAQTTTITIISINSISNITSISSRTATATVIFHRRICLCRLCFFFFSSDRLSGAAVVVAVVAEILSRLSLHRRPQIILTPVNQPSSCQSSPTAFTVTHSCAGLSHLLWVKASQRTTKHSNCPFQVRQNTLQIELLACPERELMLCTFSLHGNSLTRLALYTTLMFSFLRRFLLSSFSCQY